MKSLIYVGMDVHKESYSLCSYDQVRGVFFCETKIGASTENIEKYLDSTEEYLKINNFLDKEDDVQFIMAYEAGCLGFSLQKDLVKRGYECKIIAPTTLSKEPGLNKRKTDKQDARMLAKNLAFRTCRFVHVPDEEDQKTRELIRYRMSMKRKFKMIKQEILSFCLRHGFIYSQKVYWTQAHIKWLKESQFPNELSDIMSEYLANYNYFNDLLERIDNKILLKSNEDRYKESTDKLACLKGVTKQGALTIISEVGDFYRFGTAKEFSSYLGLTPGESSSGESRHMLGITKQGNSIVRTLLVESTQSIVRGQIGFKSKRIKARQINQKIDVISYADLATERLMKRYLKLTKKGIPHNKAITAVARELSCFIRGIMTNNLNIRKTIS